MITIGAACSYCFGVAGNSETVCSGRGSCAAPDSTINFLLIFVGCSCNQNYMGANCEQTTCFSISSADPNVCSAHGICADFDTCQCANGWSMLQ